MCLNCGERVYPATITEQKNENMAGLTKVSGSLTFCRRLPRGIGVNSGRAFQLGRFAPGLRARALPIAVVPESPGNIRVDFLVIGELIRTDP